MTVIELELPDEQAARLQLQARERGLTVAQWIAELASQASRTPDGRGARAPIWEVIADNMKDVPDEEFKNIPTDGASQVDHYLYGHPKR
ncbi:MAG: hypothetical protein JNL98_18045 [Bryobacterales bacterium]|nr:hypothetical protein [Bryobacterales bacterium]